MHEVTAHWKGDSRFQADTPGGTVTMSMAEHGALGPKALMLDALLGCTGIDVVSLIEKMRLEVEDIQLHARGELTDDHPRYYHTVDVTYSFFGSALDEEKLTKAVTLSAEKYCGVMEMFRRFAKVNIHMRFNP